MAERKRLAAPDQVARDRIVEDLETTLFVEAGAGSGKTTALVDRVVALVTKGVAELASIAAITFTEKAGAELRDRIRQCLQEETARSSGQVAERCRKALDQLDGAAIGTLHAFAQRLLSEHPIEAGLPPRVEVLDEVTSGIEFERRWTTFRDALLADPALERTIVLLLATGVRHQALRSLAAAFGDNWDLVAERVPVTAPDPPQVHRLLEEALPALDAVCDRRHHCTDPADLLCRRLDDIAAYVERLRSVADEVELLESLDPDGVPKPPSFRVGNLGKGPSWGGSKQALQEEVRDAGEHLSRVRSQVAEACAKRIGSAIRGFTLAAAEERRGDGRLEFHDLLVMARALLSDPIHGPAVRSRLHQRYQRLLLDELQDTDPIQIELATRIAAAEPSRPDSGTLAWDRLAVAPGHLFMVGDPKQSIYRFRRADIAVFLAAQARFGASGGTVTLTANFRTATPIIHWVNHVFAALMAESSDIDLPTPSQPCYVPLSEVRPSPSVGPAMAVIGRSVHPQGSRADALRDAEAADVVATVVQARAEGWRVGTGGGDRPARLGDIAILVPARTSLPFLEDHLEAAGIPYRAEAASLVYATRAVRDLLMVLRAAADPSDHLHILSALRTPLLGCGDDDLFRFKVERRGRWGYLARQPDTVPAGDPVRASLAYLRSLHDTRQWSTPSQLLDRIAAERRAFEMGFAEGRPRDVWRRLRFVIDQARAWSEATGGNLRQYLAWVELQSSEGARVAESILPETDDDAVRILTIHAAKGLEFPVTIVSGLSTLPQGRRAAAEVVFPPTGGVGYRFGRHVTTEEYADYVPIDEQMGYDERIRLLYVACTRARDHLVVSLHRRARAKPAERTKRTNAELLVDGMEARLDELPDAGVWPAAAAGVDADGPVRPAPLVPFHEWEAERSSAIARASRPTTVAATALTDEGQPGDGPESDHGRPDEGGPEPADGRPDEGLADDGRPGGGRSDDGPERDEGRPDEGRPEPDKGRPGVGQPGEGRPGVGQPDDGSAAEPADGSAAEAAPGQGLRKRPYDLDQPPWLKGRYGSAVGRAVHGVLQSVELATGAGVDAAVAAQCEAEAVPQRAGDVRRLVGHALASPTVRAAAAGPHWREVYACTPVGDRLLEGYVDLLYRRPDGLVVVDYKTAATSDERELDRRLGVYRRQGASYALAVAATTDEPVVQVTFVFLTPDGPVDRHLPDLDAAVAEVRALVGAGQEVTVV